MKHFVEILAKFTQSQRMMVLVLLLTFTTGGLLVSQYLRTDDCKSLVAENMKMQEDFVKLSSMLRKVVMQSNAEIADRTTSTEINDVPSMDSSAIPTELKSNTDRRPANEQPRPVEIVEKPKISDTDLKILDSALLITNLYVK
jgi:hypothetical protein